MNTRRYLLLPVFFLISLATYGQSNTTITDEFDLMVSDWLLRSEALRTYEGINEYCVNERFRNSVNTVLNSIHHYDSLIMQQLADPTVIGYNSHKNQQKTLKDIYKFELKYDAKGFIDEMRGDCRFRNEIELHASELRNGVGLESYDSKVLLLETRMQKYLKEVDKLVVKIDDHLHLLHLEQY